MVRWPCVLACSLVAHTGASAGDTERLVLSPERRICIAEKLDLRGGGFSVREGALESPARLALQRKLSALGAGRGQVSGRESDDRRVVRAQGPFCDPAAGDLVLELQADVDEPANSYAVTLRAGAGGGRVLGRITRPDAIGWVKSQGSGPVDGQAPDRRMLGRYIPAAMGGDAVRLVEQIAQRLVFED